MRQRSRGLRPQPEAEPREESEQVRRSLLRPIIIGVLAATLVAAVGVAAWATWFRPDLTPYDRGLRSSLELLADVQAASEALTDPGDLGPFASRVESVLARLDAIEDVAEGTESAEHRQTLVSVIGIQRNYLTELVRLATLSSQDVNDAQFDRSIQLLDELEDAIDNAIELRPGSPPVARPSLSPAPVTRVLVGLAEYREEVLAERARIRRQTQRRAARLAELQTFAGQFDGVINRYSAARGELAVWIDRVNTHGVSFLEAFQVLEQQVDVRRQLRNELAALDAPAPFGEHKEAILAVMDRAISANEAAYRGTEEYLYDFDLVYYTYEETPGWKSFQSSTTQISKDYSAAIAAYESDRDALFMELRKKRPLPELPD
jgi:hypothetical protein